MRLGASDQGTQPTQQTGPPRHTTCSLRASGRASTARSRSSSTSNGDEQAPQRVYDGVRRASGDRRVRSRKPQFNDAKTVAIVFVTPTPRRRTRRPTTLVHRLRDDVVPAATDGGDAAVYVSGLNAAFIDIADRIMQRLPIFLLYIIGVTFIVLAMAFRSIVVSLTAAITTILSAFVGFGVLTLVVQEGHLLEPDRARHDGPDRDVRAADRVRDPLRALDGLHGLPHEPHPRGARQRPEDAGGGRARHRGDRSRRSSAAAIIMATVFSAFILTPTASRRSSACCSRSRSSPMRWS